MYRKIYYFGLVPTPLAIDFGHLFHNHRHIEVYQRHHVTKRWYQEAENGGTIDLRISGLPEPSQKGIGEALVRIGISHPVSAEDTRAILPNAAEVDASLAKTSEDAISSSAIMHQVADTVKGIFDQLSANESHLDRIHLFASIPCGVAFLIGTKIAPTIHPFVQTYQYSRTDSPTYCKAILVKGTIRTERIITEDELKRIAELRIKANDLLSKEIRQFCVKNAESSSGREWFKGIVPLMQPAMQDEFWQGLPSICNTSLTTDKIDVDGKTVVEGFSWTQGIWFLNDNFIVSLSRRLKTDADIMKAIRLFLFHEALHYAFHRLNNATSENIGSFPKVLESTDYQADVYALLNEYGYSLANGGVSDAKVFFMDAVRVATETMWSFDDEGVPLDEIQIRRLNRYLIWYWQYARIELEAKTVDDVIRILQRKPDIEINGLKTREENNRFYFELEKRHSQPLELGMLHKNLVLRHGHASNLNLEQLVEGVRTLNGQMILQVMRSVASR